MDTIVEVNSVEKSYGETQVISGCSFRLREGEIYSLLGVNGAGKTTLMKMILGLQRADRGSIHVLGREAGEGPEYLADVGSMMSPPAFYEHLSGEEILDMHLSYMGKRADTAEILNLVGLSGAGKKPVLRYSFGMRQRLGLARAIVHRPRLLILDEPLNGLDPIAVTEMCGLMKKLTEEGMSILLSSHIIGEIRQTADRAGILSGGRIVKEFSVEEKTAQWGERFEDCVIDLMRRN